MNNKVYIISANHLTVEFWHSQLKTETIETVLWNDPLEAISQLESDNPMAIILDDYFTSVGDKRWMKEAVQLLRSAKYLKRIFCLSPEFIDEKNQMISSIPMAICYSFSNEFLTKLNSVIEQQDENYEYRYWNFKHSYLNSKQKV